MPHRMSFIFSFLIVILLFNHNTYATFHNYDNFDHPLIDAVNSGNSALAEKLLVTGNDVNSKGFLNSTALMRAAYKGDVKMVKLLLSYGANINDKDIGGATALHFAVRTNHKEIVNILISAGAHAHAKDKLGVTPHERAKYTRNNDVIEVLDNEVLTSIINEVSESQVHKNPTELTNEVKVVTVDEYDSAIALPIDEDQLIDELSTVNEEKTNVSSMTQEIEEETTDTLRSISEVQKNFINNEKFNEYNSDQDGLKISVAKKVDENYIKNLEDYADNKQIDALSQKSYLSKIKLKIDGFLTLDEALNAWDIFAQSKYFKKARITFSANGGFSKSELFIEIGFFDNRSNALSACLRVKKLVPNKDCKIIEN